MQNNSSALPHSRRAALAAGVCLLWLLALASCSNDGASKKEPTGASVSSTPTSQTQTAGQPPRTSLPMPPVESAHRTSQRAGDWTLLDGRRAGLAELRGQVVVLDFYATYCPPCRDEIPHLVALQRRFGPQGFKVIGLNVGGAEDQVKVPEYVKALGIQYQLANPDNELVGTLLADDDAIPQTFVFDRQGRLLQHFTGFDDETAQEMEKTVQAAVADKVASQ